ncbi:MAG: B12-binding domain-containing radical SAM protein [Chloroflexi bacterium]|nr:B12-binding domain-containing radical SAM protein [Chloroflexota bacterium]
MRSTGAILLVSCYELGHQPLSLAWPLAFLRSAGYDPVAVDLSVDSLDDATIARAGLVAISVPMHTALRLGVGVAERVRRVNPKAHVCFFGHYAALNSSYLLDQLGDSVVAGEYEPALVDLAAALERGNRPQLPGVTTTASPAAPKLARLSFPVPVRAELPDLSRYARLQRGSELSLAGYVEASRGCLHTCRHCPITPVYGGRFFVVPADVVLADVRAQVAAGARHVTFGDPDFLNGPGHSMKIVRAIHAEFPDLTFDVTVKIEHILERRELFPELGALGCLFVVSAVESLSDRVLGALDKGHTKEDVVAAIRITRNAGLHLRPSLVAFTPWTTLDDYLEVVDFVAEHDLIDDVDPVQFSIRLLIPPGSALLEENHTAPWLGRLDDAAFTYEWTHPDPRMDQLHRDVAALVEVADADGRDPHDTFAAIRALAYTAAGRAAPTRELVAVGAGASPPRERPPRLTESWFC